MSNNQLETTSTEEIRNPVEPLEASKNPMEEYYQLKQNLLLVTLGLTAVIFVSVWIAYSLNTAANYLLGACVGVVYLGMLAREVERIGASNKKGVGSTRLALLASVIIVATQLQQLQIVPIFLGFLTYKAAIIAYVLQTTLTPAK